MANRIVGPIEGVPDGAVFATRQALSSARVHRPPQAGISGSQKEGADSIVLSRKDEDDIDNGDMVIYTGHGGRDEHTGRQTSDQEWTLGNKALLVSHERGLPVRGIRKVEEGYRYDSLFRVEKAWREVGRSGFQVGRFRLVLIDRDR